MKNQLTKLLLILCITLYCSTIASAQQQCDIGADDGFWHISLPNSKRIANAEQSYLCHQFVRMYFEGNCPKPTWNSQILPNCWCSWGLAGITYLPNEFYWNTNIYVQVNSETDATIARYRVYSGTNTIMDHSQVKDALEPGKYLSKYNNQGPLVGHVLNSNYYYIENSTGSYTYWAYLGLIAGPSNITNSTPVTYSVVNNSGVQYTWTIESTNPCNCATITSTNGNSVQVTGYQAGTATLQLKAKSGNLQEKIQQKTLNITFTPGQLITGKYDNAGVYNLTLNTVNRVSVGGVFIRVSCPGASTFTWQKTSGNINGYFPNGPTASFNMTSGGSISFLVTAKNSAGCTITSRSLTFYN